MIADAVFEGGGMRGIGIIGALNYFNKKGYKWNRTAGTSVGAIIAALISAGYTPKEMQKIMVKTDFTKFLDKDGIQRIPLVGRALGFIKEKGIYSGEYFENWASNLLKVKHIEKFKDVSENGESKLKIIASDITRKKIMVLPDNLVDYGIDPMEFKIVNALRMSMSIPFYFKPVKFEYKDGISYIVDGAVCCNYPIKVFDVKDTPRWPTIGFKFENRNNSYTSKGRTDAMAFLLDIASTMSLETSGEYLDDKDKIRTVLIPTEGVETTEFDISNERSIKLYKSGYRSARKFLKEWDFQRYVQKYRTQNATA